MKGGYKWFMLGLLSLAFFFSQADRVLFGLLTIPIQDELHLTDLQVGVVNWNSNGDESSARRSIGVQYGLLNYADSFLGLQDAWINISSGNMSGLQYGFLNCAADVHGVQCGALLVAGVNIASGSVSGCQIGIVNYAGRMESGLQIGIVNVIARGGFFPVLPILNGSF